MLWCCDQCTTLYAAYLYGGCPHCRHPDFHEFGSRPEDEEHPMSPKISRHSGASVAAAEVGPRVVEEPAAPPEPEPDDAGELDVEEPSDPPADGPSNADVREWARGNEIEVSDSGPIPRAVRDAYDAAHTDSVDDDEAGEPAGT